jgi:nickel-type superoxide dismutase maturation protease
MLVLGVCTAATLAELAWWAWRRSERVEVEGLSMAPTLQPGDRLLIWTKRELHIGDVVAAPDPRDKGRVILKRVGATGRDGLLLLGDNPGHSTDSRHFGRVPASSIRGKVVYRYAPASRAGRLPRT